MIAAAGLLAYAGLLLAAAPPLARAGWPDRAPRLAIAAWLALAYSAASSVALAGLALLIPAERLGGLLGWVFAACGTADARYAHPGGLPLAAAGGVLATAVASRMAWCAATTLAATARAGRRHRRRLRLAGRRTSGWAPSSSTTPSPPPTACRAHGARSCSPRRRCGCSTTPSSPPWWRTSGRTRPAATTCWSPSPRLPAAAFGRVPAFRHARNEVTRLAELAADDAATARSPRLAVAGALLALGSAPALARALGAGGSTAAARVRRLIAAPRPLSRAASAAGGLAVAALSAIPLVLLAVPDCCVFGAVSV